MAELICYRCGATLSRQNVCLQCGEDMLLYKKIKYSADQLYNLGLERAKYRDLSAAINYLKEAIQMNKAHIQARNLLGLIYYEIGEPAYALKEWVISTSFQPEDNIAQKYLKNTEKNLNSINGSVSRYNMAVTYIKNNSRDLAMVQLKTLMNRPYRVMKAMQMLALLYIQEEHYSKAQKLLKECHKIDKGNPITRRYFRELEEHKRASRSSSYRDAMSKVISEGKTVTDSDVIIPKSIREYGSYFMYVLYIIIGVMLGAGLVYFIVVPTVRTKEQEQNRINLISYEDAMGDWQNELVKKNAQVETLEKTVDELKNTIGQYENEDDVLTYDVFIPVLEAYTNNNPQDIEEAFCALSFDTENKEYMRVYNMIKADVLSNLGNYAFYLASQYLTSGKYEKALKMYKYSVEKTGYTSANLYYIGCCYQLMGQYGWAIYYYQYSLVTFPEGDHFNGSQSNMNTVLSQNSELEIPKVVAGELGDGKVEMNYMQPETTNENGDMVKVTTEDDSAEKESEAEIAETTEETETESEAETTEETVENVDININ